MEKTLVVHITVFILLLKIIKIKKDILENEKFKSTNC